jgi:site-specific DNA recombinase
MTGTNQGNDRRYYRCELRRSRPGARIDHPVDVYVREQPLVEALDDWLDELFAPGRAAETARTIVEAAAHDPAHQSRVDHGQHSLAEARRKLAQYRAALDGGADPATVTAWISQAATQERAARVELEDLASQAPAPLSADEALNVVDRLGGMPGLLQQAGPDDRAALYAALGVSATYDPTTRSAELTVAIPRSAKNVSEGGLEPPRPKGH